MIFANIFKNFFACITRGKTKSHLDGSVGEKPIESSPNDAAVENRSEKTWNLLPPFSPERIGRLKIYWQEIRGESEIRFSCQISPTIFPSDKKHNLRNPTELCLYAIC